jgi:hypothetical protein
MNKRSGHLTNPAKQPVMNGTIGAIICVALFTGVTIGIFWLIAYYTQPNAMGVGVVFFVACMGGLGAAAGFAYFWHKVLRRRDATPDNQ